MNHCAHCTAIFDDDVETCPSDAAALTRLLPGPPLLDARYELERLIGAGGMGIVCQARHRGLGKRFAVKLLPASFCSDPNLLERFRREATALATLQHPNIVSVTDSGVDAREGGLPYLVMERLQGGTLAEAIDSGRRWTAEEALGILDLVAGALDHAHQCGILHRDLKPLNIVLENDPAGGVIPKVVDLGLARWLRRDDPIGDEAQPSAGELRFGAPLDTRLTVGGGVAGTLAYIAPELHAGEEPGTASDIYAFGVVASELLDGRLISDLPPDVLPPVPDDGELHPDVEAALSAALRHDAAERPDTAREVVDGLRRAIGNARRDDWETTESPRRLLLAAAVALLVMLLHPMLAELRPVKTAELATIDGRSRLLPLTPPDPRLLIVSLDEASIGSLPLPPSQMPDEFAAAIDGLFRAGARIVAIDLLLPSHWRDSESFNTMVARNSGRLVLAAFSGSDGSVIGPETLSPLTAAVIERNALEGLFAFVNLTPDSDGAIRRARTFFLDAGGGEQPAFATRTALRAGLLDDRPAREIWIDPTIERNLYDRISWMELAETVRQQPERIRDRIVVVGGDFASSGEDAHAIDGRGTELAGSVLQATIIDSLLRPAGIRSTMPALSRVVAGVAVLLLAAVVLLRRDFRPSLAMGAGLVLIWTLAAVVLFRINGFVLDLVPVVTSVAAGGLLATAIRPLLARFPE